MEIVTFTGHRNFSWTYICVCLLCGDFILC